jgi:hypothetical protein
MRDGDIYMLFRLLVLVACSGEDEDIGITIWRDPEQ